MIKVKIKRFLSSENVLKFPKNDMHMWLSAAAMSDLGILEASQRSPQYIKIECKAPLNRFTIYGAAACLNPKIEIEEGFLWIPSELVHKSIIFDKNTEVQVSAVPLDECIVAESVSVRLNEKEVENWSEEESDKAMRNFKIHNGIAFLNECAFVKPGTKNPVIGVVDSIFPRPESHTQLFVVNRDTKVFFEGLPKNQQKVIDFNQIGGLDNVIEKLREIIQIPVTCPEHLARFGIKSPKGMLMYGPPGNGKTMIARAVAQSMGSAFISIEGPELMSKYVGVGEQRLREKFEEAETKGNCVIFIDEIDSIASVRSDSAAEYQVSIVATLLNLMDGMKSNNVFVIGATNRINAIDPALRRPGRFDLEFEVPLPATASRFDILKKYVKLEKEYLFESNVTEQTLRRLAELTNGYSGADLSLLYREAAMLAVRRNIAINSTTGKLEEQSELEKTRIGEDDFYEAMKHIVPTAMRNEESNHYDVHWDELAGVDSAKNELERLQKQMTLFANSEDVLTRPSFASFVLCGQPGAGKHTLVHAFASRYGYEMIDIDIMRLLTMDMTSAYSDIEKKFAKAKQVAPSVISVSHVPDSPEYQKYVDKILHEANMVNKRSMVFVALLHDGDARSADRYIGYKKFGRSVQLDIPDADIVRRLMKKNDIPEDKMSLFEGKPMGQLISMLNEYSMINKMQL